MKRLLMAMLIVSAGYAYAQRDVFGGFGVLRGEQGDPAGAGAQPAPLC